MAAHDEALRAELTALPATELAGRKRALQREANFEAEAEHAYKCQVKAVQERRSQYEAAVASTEAAEALGWRERRRELPHALEREEQLRERLNENVQELAGMQPPGTAARQEHESAAQLLARGEAQMLMAMQLKPPPYILKELGERPTERFKRDAWDRAAGRIEHFRQAHGVTDRVSALGREPKDSSQRMAREAAEASLRRAQRDLGCQQRPKSRERAMGTERSLGIGR
jgi:hypothetical protein